jgi:outer membrane protein TolC
VAALAISVTSPLSAQQQPAGTQAPSDAHVKALIETAMTTLQTQSGGQKMSPAVQGQGQGPRVDLTADEAVARAMERNVTLASQRLTPRTFDYALAATWATYRPTVTSSVVTNSQTQLPTVTIEGGDIVNTDTNNWNAGLNQALRWGGGQVTANWQNNRVFTSRNTATLNPSYGSTFRVQYTQPLLQNFKIDTTRASLLTTAIQQDIAEIDLQATIASTVAQVRNAYWELSYAIANLEAQRGFYDLSTRLVADNRARVEIGTMAPIDVVQAQAEQATRRQAVVNAEATLRNTELNLKRLIVSGTDDPLWASTLNAIDRPSPGPEQVDIEASVRNALANRTDLISARRNIESANVTLRSLNNQTMPSLNLVTTYQLDGRGGRSLSEIAPSDTGWGNALRNIGRLDAPTWTLQLNFSYPIGTSQAEANKARQEVIIQQNQTEIKATELQIATEITAAALAVTSSLEAIQAAQVARELSEQRANAAQSKLEVGMATNFEVVQAQRDLADARNRELREQLNYRRALVDLQRAQVSPR